MKNKGFTLIELLVVVAIIGILAAVGVVAYSGYTSGANKSAVESNFKMIEKIGLLTNSTPKATLLNQEIKNEFNQLKNFKTTPSVLYLIWNQPIMSIGKDTFIHEMLGLAGFENCCAKFERYPEIRDKMELNPAYIFLSSEPFPFKEKHLEIIHAKFPKAKCVFVNGEMFSWYGSRMKFAPKYFSSLRDSLGLNN